MVCPLVDHQYKGMNYPPFLKLNQCIHTLLKLLGPSSLTLLLGNLLVLSEAFENKEDKDIIFMLSAQIIICKGWRSLNASLAHIQQ